MIVLSMLMIEADNQKVGNGKMSIDLTRIYQELTVMKTLDLEECNRELQKNHSETVKKALMIYKTELLECLKMYDHYLNHG
jgi:hypothetical protein